MNTIEWAGGKIRIIDQTLLPLEEKYIYLRTVEDAWNAIKTLQVRGAPAIGIAGAMGAVLSIWNFPENRFQGFNGFMKRLSKNIKYLASSRPTAENLFWALDRIRKCAVRNKNLPLRSLKKALLGEALAIQKEDDKMCRAIGAHGSKLIKKGCTILTHCNAGGLATSGYGTALAVIYTAQKQKKKIKVYADETRPLLQGARLTSWELKKAGVDVTLICDTMAGKVMSEGRVDCVIVGADRIAANGDAANKIGTYQVAVLARFHKIPFYVAAPSSTFDLSLKTGKGIPIEERDPKEVREVFGKKTAPPDVKVYNPAFDVTPAELITGIITEKGVLYPPFAKSIKKHF